MDAEPDSTGLSQRSAYEALFETLRAALADALARGSRRLLAAYLQSLLAFPDGCTQGRDGLRTLRPARCSRRCLPLSEEKLYPKERALIDLVAAERLEGRRVLVYVTHTGPATSPGGWTTSSHGTGSASRS